MPTFTEAYTPLNVNGKDREQQFTKVKLITLACHAKCPKNSLKKTVNYEYLLHDLLIKIK